MNRMLVGSGRVGVNLKIERLVHKTPDVALLNAMCMCSNMTGARLSHACVPDVCTGVISLMYPNSVTPVCSRSCL